MFSFSALVTLISIFYSSILKEVYKGDFEIYVKKDNQNSRQISSSETKLISKGKTDFKT